MAKLSMHLWHLWVLPFLAISSDPETLSPLAKNILMTLSSSGNVPRLSRGLPRAA